MTELKTNNTKFSLSEHSFSIHEPTSLTGDAVFSESGIKSLISILSDWKLSLQYLRFSYYFLKFTPAQSEQLFRSLLNCPILRELNIKSKIEGRFKSFCIPQHLQSLTLLCLDNACEVLRSLKDNRLHSIKNLKLRCHFDCNVDKAIGEYLQTDIPLEELTLKCVHFKSNPSHLVQGLQGNTCLTKITINIKKNLSYCAVIRL